MPVILSFSSIDRWLSQDELPSAIARSIPGPSNTQMRNVSMRLNNADHDAADAPNDHAPVETVLGL
jgi:hypothetical protein